MKPLIADRKAEWHPFDFAAGVGLASHTVSRDPNDVILLDGVYSGRPELSDMVDLTVLVEAPDELTRRRRLIARESEPFMTSWHALWDAAEDYYFTQVRPRSTFDLIVTLD